MCRYPDDPVLVHIHIHKVSFFLIFIFGLAFRVVEAIPSSVVEERGDEEVFCWMLVSLPFLIDERIRTPHPRCEISDSLVDGKKVVCALNLVFDRGALETRLKNIPCRAGSRDPQVVIERGEGLFCGVIQ